MYIILKGAMTQMTKALAAEWAKDGVRVNQINPGLVESEAYQNIGIPEEAFSALRRSLEEFADELRLAAIHWYGRGDDDLLVEATHRQQEDIDYGGVIFVHQLRISIGTCSRDLDLIAKAGEPEDLVNKVLFLPL